MSAAYAEPKKGMAIASLVLGILSLLTSAASASARCRPRPGHRRRGQGRAASPHEYGGKGMAWAGIVTSGARAWSCCRSSRHRRRDRHPQHAARPRLGERGGHHRRHAHGHLRAGGLSVRRTAASTTDGSSAWRSPASAWQGYDGPALPGRADLASGTTKSGYSRELVAGAACRHLDPQRGLGAAVAEQRQRLRLRGLARGARQDRRCAASAATRPGSSATTPDGSKPNVNDAPAT